MKSGADEWLYFWKYDENARSILHANPSALTGYDESKADLLNAQSGNYEYMRDGDGLVETFEQDSCSGYLSAIKIQKGELGTPIKLAEYEYASCCVGASAPSPPPITAS